MRCKVPDSSADQSVPPPIALTWCPKCGRTDRWQPLKERHFAAGKLCDGKPIRVRYEPVQQGALR
jgi:hypothetical protein